MHNRRAIKIPLDRRPRLADNGGGPTGMIRGRGTPRPNREDRAELARRGERTPGDNSGAAVAVGENWPGAVPRRHRDRRRRLGHGRLRPLAPRADERRRAVRGRPHRAGPCVPAVPAPAAAGRRFARGDASRRRRRRLERRPGRSVERRQGGSQRRGRRHQRPHHRGSAGARRSSDARAGQAARREDRISACCRAWARTARGRPTSTRDPS